MSNNRNYRRRGLNRVLLNPTRWISGACGNWKWTWLSPTQRDENTITYQSLSHTALTRSLTLPQTLPARSPQWVYMKTRKRGEQLQYRQDSLHSHSLTGGIAYHYSKHGDAGLVLSFLYHCFTTCRNNIMLHLWPVTRRWASVFEHLVLYSIEYAPVGSYRARQRGSLSSWTAGPLLRAGRLQLRDYYWVLGIYRTSGWASSFSPSPSPPICLCGFIKGPDGLSETGLHCCNKIHSLNPEVWQRLWISCIIPFKNNVVLKYTVTEYYFSDIYS